LQVSSLGATNNVKCFVMVVTI